MLTKQTNKITKHQLYMPPIYMYLRLSLPKMRVNDELVSCYGDAAI